MAVKRGKARKKSRPKSRQPIQAKPGGDNATGVKRRGVPQKHGGALVPGAGRGPKKGAPNAGRPPNALRALLRQSFEKRIPVLEAIADGKVIERRKIAVDVPATDDAPGGTVETEHMVSASVPDRLRAVDMLGKYGLGTTITPTDGDGNDLTIFTLAVGAAGDRDE